jgi:hypoxia induced protein
LAVLQSYKTHEKPDHGFKTAAGRMARSAGWCYVAAMATILSNIVLPIAVGAVALVLLMGLVNMMRGGSPNTSQKLMRLRVLLQFVVICVTMFTLWIMGR